MTVHPIPPIYDQNSRILILGSFPSVKSREEGFFYGHRRNRFWSVLAALLDLPTPATVEEKRKMLLSSGIALWDVIASCEIKGSADSSIRDAEPNDLTTIVNNSRVKCIFLNGKSAEKYYRKFCADSISVPAICLPSTSPANAACSLDDLIEGWRAVTDHLAN